MAYNTIAMAADAAANNAKPSVKSGQGNVAATVASAVMTPYEKLANADAVPTTSGG